MRGDRYDRRLKYWWVAADNIVMDGDTVMDTQPIMLEVGFIDFDAPDWKPVDVTVPKRTAESVLWEIMAALREDGLH